MKISEQWLREWISPALNVQALAERLTLAGLEVSGVTPVAAPLKNIVVGEIISIAPHADHLKICKVGIGKAKPVDIVCGATNAAAGLKAPVALAGAVLANGTAIKPMAVQGVASAGILCSAAELGLEESSTGLLILDQAAKPGTPIYDYLDLNDNCIEIDLTPNRGDCLSIVGIARELAVLTHGRLKAPTIKSVPVKGKRNIKVSVRAKKDCPRYVGGIIENINPQATTPVWMKERLRRSGIRSIHPAVDVTNYVMLELGQPMHAFDLDKLSGGITVRHAEKGERLTLLDGNNLTAEAGILLIADDRGPLALAGVMGGLDSAVTMGTKNIFLESAYFQPEIVAKQARELNLHTESSHRFERGVDPGLQRQALQRASALLIDIVGGSCAPLVEVSANAHLPKRSAILLRQQRITRLLGFTPPAKAIVRILTALGMHVKNAAQGWRVTPSSYRFDIKQECDLIEEVARIYGYEKLPSQMPRFDMAQASLLESRLPEGRIRDGLIDRDYQEVITYSFVDPDLQKLIEPAVTPAALANPIASTMSVMRTSLWPGLLQAVLYNQNRQQARIRLFEIGRRFVPVNGKINQDKTLAGVITGAAFAEQWGIKPGPADFYDLKGDVEALLDLTGGRGQFRFKPTTHPALHPGQAAELLRNAKSIGFLGALHPQIQRKLDLDGPVFLFELQLSPIQQAMVPSFQEISKFPSIRRDIAVIIDRQIPAQEVLDCVSRTAGQLLVNLELFDEYRGEGIDSGRKSLALGLTLQDTSRTLKEEVVEAVMTQVITTLQSRFGAQLRQ